MAQLLRRAMNSGAPPSLARIPMTPEEVAASYETVMARPARPGPAGALSGHIAARSLEALRTTKTSMAGLTFLRV